MKIGNLSEEVKSIKVEGQKKSVSAAGLRNVEYVEGKLKRLCCYSCWLATQPPSTFRAYMIISSPTHMQCHREVFSIAFLQFSFLPTSCSILLIETIVHRFKRSYLLVGEHCSTISIMPLIDKLCS